MFPSLKIVTSEIDASLNEEYRVIPGLGEFGDRYFGTDDWSVIVEMWRFWDITGLAYAFELGFLFKLLDRRSADAFIWIS